MSEQTDAPDSPPSAQDCPAAIRREVLMLTQEIRIPAEGIQSLCWQGDALVDWAAGGKRYNMDGTTQDSHVRYSDIFDAAAVSPSGNYAVIYTRLGTKGLVLGREGEIREINRSYYCSDAYEYPVAIFRLKSGQEVIAHCPDRYNRLEIDDLVTGERLTRPEPRKPSDHFFSRLAADESGAFLLSAGWYWHPMDVVRVFDVEAALKDPSHLDNEEVGVKLLAEESSACFGEHGQLIAWLSQELNKSKAKREADHPFGVLCTYDLHVTTSISEVCPQAKIGTIGLLGKHHVVGFYEHPRVFDLRTGAVIHEWPDLQTGRQCSSVIWHIDAPPPIAVDAKNARFAVADKAAITVVQCTFQ